MVSRSIATAVGRRAITSLRAPGVDQLDLDVQPLEQLFGIGRVGLGQAAASSGRMRSTPPIERAQAAQPVYLEHLAAPAEPAPPAHHGADRGADGVLLRPERAGLIGVVAGPRSFGRPPALDSRLFWLGGLGGARPRTPRCDHRPSISRPPDRRSRSRRSQPSPRTPSITASKSRRPAGQHHRHSFPLTQTASQRAVHERHERQ